MPTTGLGKFPYPDSSQIPDVPGDLLLLAQRIAKMGGAGVGYAATSGDLASLASADAFAGLLVYYAAADCLVRFDGTGFRLEGVKRFADSSARTAWLSSYSSLLSVGDELVEVDTSTTYRWTGGVAQPWDSPWVTYSPTVVGFVVGTGGSVSQFSWRYLGGRVRVKYLLVRGSTGASAAGTTFTLPVNRETVPVSYDRVSGVGVAAGASTSYATSHSMNATDVGRVRVLYVSGSGEAPLGASAPFAWAAGAFLSGEIEYDPA